MGEIVDIAERLRCWREGRKLGYEVRCEVTATHWFDYASSLDDMNITFDTNLTTPCATLASKKS